MTQSFFQLAKFSLGGSFSHLRLRPIAPLAKGTWSIGGARANPDLREVNDSNTLFGQLMTTLRRRRIHQQWQRDLRALDDRQLRDIGISRADAERARADAERAIDRIRFWI